MSTIRGQPHHREQSFGFAVPHTITRRAHPKARPETVETPPPTTGIDYLALTAAAHHEQLREDERIGYHALYGTDADGDQVAGQLSITDLTPAEDARAVNNEQ
ncbi:hypothetical protein ACNUDN_29820 [Mycobacterium sp. smrl_JER01]|uniref:hypothetical protein n=1 Tax=Mycobacterium sp. smrl_JER01 TaxID=3402633 RepID=UPI003AD5E622